MLSYTNALQLCALHAVAGLLGHGSSDMNGFHSASIIFTVACVQTHLAAVLTTFYHTGSEENSSTATQTGAFGG